MAKFSTSSGTVQVKTWGYVLQGSSGTPLDANLLSSATHDLLVIDSSRDGTNAGRFSADEITRMKDGMGGESLVASYISIGEASDFRDYWDAGWTRGGKASDKLTGKAPNWLGPVNPDWPESRKVRYWDAEWQELLYNDARTGALDAIVKQGFDAAYLDIVDAYYFWGKEAVAKDKLAGDPTSVKQAAQRMVDFIVSMTDHARESNPDFFVIPQNGAFILNDLGSDSSRRAAFLDAIGGIAVEDLYNPGDADENNSFDPDRNQIAVLQRDFLEEGKVVFAVDYLNDPKLVKEFHKQAVKDGFIPYAAPDRDLDHLVGTHDGTAAYKKPTNHADMLRGSQLHDRIDGLSGDDSIYGRGGGDHLNGGEGSDQLYGGEGYDRLAGNSGNDILHGGVGRDTLNGGTGIDAASYAVSRKGVTADLRGIVVHTGDAGGDIFIGIENLTGSAHADLLLGNHLANTLSGKGSSDMLEGMSGNDRLFGEGGDDVLRGGMGHDVLAGGAGKDELLGQRGDDTLYGGSGNDVLIGGMGDDFLAGGHGADKMAGGTGADIFLFTKGSNRDVVMDFQDNIDTITLRDLSITKHQQALSHASRVGSDVVFDFGNDDFLIIRSVTLAQLGDDLSF